MLTLIHSTPNKPWFQLLSMNLINIIYARMCNNYIFAYNLVISCPFLIILFLFNNSLLTYAQQLELYSL